MFIRHLFLTMTFDTLYINNVKVTIKEFFFLNTNLKSKNNVTKIQKTIVDCKLKLNTSKLSLFGDFFDNINFDNLNNSLNNLKETLGRITGKELKWLNWLYYNLLRPLGEWTLNNAVPAFIDLLNASLILTRSITFIRPSLLYSSS